jgi:hypothetical protein
LINRRQRGLVTSLSRVAPRLSQVKGFGQ